MDNLPNEPPQQPDTPPAPLTPQPAYSTVFLGPNGLRAGWSILWYVALIALFLFLSRFEMRWVAARLHHKVSSGHFYPSIAIIGEATALLVVVVATAIMGRFEGHSAAFYGLAGIDRVRQFLIGIVSGFGFLSLLVGILAATHHLTLNLAAAPVGRATAYAAAWALAFLLVGFTEELLLRGYLLFTLARGIRFWPAAILLAALFGFMHSGNHGESVIGETSAALIALVFSLSLWRLGHLWWAIGFHASWDWAESYFYGTADSGTVSYGRLMHAHPAGAVVLSGGTVGPEGSVWVLLIVVLAALFVWKTQPMRGIRLHSIPKPSASPAHPIMQEVSNGEAGNFGNSGSEARQGE